MIVDRDACRNGEYLCVKDSFLVYNSDLCMLVDVVLMSCKRYFPAHLFCWCLWIPIALRLALPGFARVFRWCFKMLRVEACFTHFTTRYVPFLTGTVLVERSTYMSLSDLSSDKIYDCKGLIESVWGFEGMMNFEGFRILVDYEGCSKTLYCEWLVVCLSSGW